MSSYPLWAGGHLFNLLIINHLLSTGDNKDSRAAGRVGGVAGGIAERLAEGTAAINALSPQIVQHSLDAQLTEPLVMSAASCGGSLSDNDKLNALRGLKPSGESFKISLCGSAELETVIGELNGKILKNLIGAARLKLCVFFLKGLHPGLQRGVLGLGRSESLILSLSGSLTVRLRGSAGHGHRGQGKLGFTQLAPGAPVAGF